MRKASSQVEHSNSFLYFRTHQGSFFWAINQNDYPLHEFNSLQLDMKPLSAKNALGQTPALKEPHLHDQWVFWLEQRQEEEGRMTVLSRPWGKSHLAPQELTPYPIDVRTRIHTYGGGAFASAIKDKQVWISWIDDCNGCLWFQQWTIQSEDEIDNQPFFKANHLPICLSSPGTHCLADGLIDLKYQRWIGVMEQDEKDYLVSYSFIQDHKKVKVLYTPKDFLGYVTISPDGMHLAWVEWQQPAMPWEASQIYCCCLDELGEINAKFVLAGSSPEKKNRKSVFQPIWLETGELVVSEDSNGWSNLIINDSKINSESSKKWRYLWPIKAEFAMPQWVYGMSIKSSANNKILACLCDNGSWKLKLFSLDGSIKEINQPFDDLSYLSSDSWRAVAVASNSITESGLLELDLNTGSWQHTPVRRAIMSEDEISVGQSLWFEGWDKKQTHAWYYPPSFKKDGSSPLLVKSHSGPTSMAKRGLNLGIQFWTSRGWGVVDVNYGGSSGFGREYRERLNHGWGVVDVFDCSAAAKTLIDLGKTDPAMIAIEGGSAGGFTTLACLCFTDVFRVGACRYAVSDLKAMAEDTHRFEKCYLDSLLGEFAKYPQRYGERSPLNNSDKIKSPVIFFQGLKDKVVPPEQTEKMATILRENNIDVELQLFKNEGHGFRDINTKIKVLEATESFFNKHLGF